MKIKMAAPLCRLVKSLSAKKKTSYSRCVIYLNTKRDFNTGTTKPRVEDEKNLVSGKRCFLTLGIIAVSGLGYILYKWKNDLFNSIDLSRSLLPIVNAKTFFTADVSQNRDRYNFIADVVEISAPSVVYIEIKDQKR